ncbi:MAG: YgfZ/GcvT domain-containing protein [Holosporales bacterium]
MPIAQLNRGILNLSGEDVIPFLQGIMTQDAQRLQQDPALYAAFLNPQGRLLHDFLLVPTETGVLLDTEAERCRDLLRRMSLYKLRSKVVIEDVSANYKVLVAWGNKDASHLQSLGHAVMDPRLMDLGWRIYQEAHAPNAATASAEEYDLHRLQLGAPDGSRDMIPEKAIPLECGLDELNAISWTKGCYLGQELTARTKYRGLVRKRLLPVRLEGPASPGDSLTLGGEEVGEMRSTHESSGLARLKLDAVHKAIQDGTPFHTSSGATATPMIPSWMRLPSTDAQG